METKNIIQGLESGKLPELPISITTENLVLLGITLLVTAILAILVAYFFFKKV